MYKRILVPVDGSEVSGKALAAALAVAQLKGGRVRLLHVLEQAAHVSAYALHLARDYARKVLDEAGAQARAAGVDCDQRLVDAPGGRLGEIVADQARAWEADLVVVGTHGRRGAGRVLLGSGAEQVIRLAPVPVLSVVPSPSNLSKEFTMYKRILVPVDGSDTSTKALVAALQLAREAGGRVRLVHALDELAYVTGYEFGADIIGIAREQAGKVLADALEVAKAAGVPADTKLLEVPGQRLGEVVAEAARGWEADLVAVGTHGRRGIGRVLLGSGAEQVIRSSAVPVLSVRGEDRRVEG